jgi:hypothetical protein
LTDQGLRTIVDLGSKTVETLDLLKSLNKLRLSLPNLPAGLKAPTINSFKTLVAVGGTTSSLLGAYTLINWDRMVKITPTTTTTTADATTTTSSSSSKTATPYLIRSKGGTDKEVFLAMVNALDGGKGGLSLQKIAQAYCTRLTPSQVDQIKKLDYIRAVNPN